MQYDLILKGGRVIDPAQGIDALRDVAIAGDRIAALLPPAELHAARRVVDVDGLLVTPGLIDVHVHIYEGVSHYGANADEICLRQGVTTAVDAGSAGAQTFPGLRKYVMEPARTRLLAHLNLSAAGMIGPQAGELEDIRWMDVDAALRTLENHRDRLLGIKVRMEPGMVGTNGREVLRVSRRLSEATGLPVIYHIGNTTPPLEELLAQTCPGDIITHCFTGRAGGLLDESGRVLPEVWDAARRGVMFDVGHGRSSFSFDVARRALDQGLLPATISSDLHVYCLNGPVFDLPTTMSKFMHLGLSLEQVIELTTSAPAAAIGMKGEIGTLRAGACADVTILDLVAGPVSLTDANYDDRSGTAYKTEIAEKALIPAGVVRGGDLVFFKGGSRNP